MLWLWIGLAFVAGTFWGIFLVCLCESTSTHAVVLDPRHHPECSCSYCMGGVWECK